jgi:hypothetical protein
MTERSVAIDWIAAFLAPWTISPHPNFSTDHVSSQQALALVTERRADRNARQPDAVDYGWEDWAQELVDNARRSLAVDTQLQATEKLWALSTDDRLPLGAQIAAAAYASLGSLEQEHAAYATEQLEAFVNKCAIRQPVETASASYRLAVAVLAQQWVVRAQDADRNADAERGIRTVLQWLPNDRTTDFEEFPVSMGISWTSRRVQRDIAVSTKLNAVASRAYIEQGSGDTWVRVIKGRSGWIDMRHYVLEKNRNAAVLRDDFENKFESTSGKRVFMRESTTDTAYATLLAAELSGDLARMRNSRAEMAKIHLLGSADLDFSTREALRLLRHSRASTPLKSALAWLRAEGPLDQLRLDALSILSRTGRDAYVTEPDLLVLEASADLLDTHELSLAIDAVLLFSKAHGVAGAASWSTLDKAWQALRRLSSGSERDNDLALRLLELADDASRVQRPLSNTLAQVVAQLDWQAITPATKKQWRAWVKSQRELTEENEALIYRLREALGLGVDALDNATGLEMAAILADEGLRGPAAQLQVEEARTAIINALESETSDAIGGSFSFGGMAPSNVAVAFALRLRDDDVWNAIIANLTHPKVSSDQKSLALDRLAHQASDVPDFVRRELARQWQGIAESPRNSWGRSFQPDIFPEALRMAAAFQALDLSKAIEAVLHLSAGGDVSKMEACLSIPFVDSGTDATWSHTLLLQLSEDSNPNVRAEAGFALVRVMNTRSYLGSMVQSRIIKLLMSDGIRVPLRVLHALQAEALMTPLNAGNWTTYVRELLNDSKPRVVRDAAGEFLRAVGDGLASP